MFQTDDMTIDQKATPDTPLWRHPIFDEHRAAVDHIEGTTICGVPST
jgi:hypothetical protein